MTVKKHSMKKADISEDFYNANKEYFRDMLRNHALSEDLVKNEIDYILEVRSKIESRLRNGQNAEEILSEYGYDSDNEVYGFLMNWGSEDIERISPKTIVNMTIADTINKSKGAKMRKKSMRKDEKEIPIEDSDVVEIEEENGQKVVEIESKDDHKKEVESGEESESDNLNKDNLPGEDDDGTYDPNDDPHESEFDYGDEPGYGVDKTRKHKVKKGAGSYVEFELSNGVYEGTWFNNNLRFEVTPMTMSNYDNSVDCENGGYLEFADAIYDVMDENLKSVIEEDLIENEDKRAVIKGWEVIGDKTVDTAGGYGIDKFSLPMGWSHQSELKSFEIKNEYLYLGVYVPIDVYYTIPDDDNEYIYSTYVLVELNNPIFVPSDECKSKYQELWTYDDEEYYEDEYVDVEKSKVKKYSGLSFNDILSQAKGKYTPGEPAMPEGYENNIVGTYEVNGNTFTFENLMEGKIFVCLNGEYLQTFSNSGEAIEFCDNYGVMEKSKYPMPKKGRPAGSLNKKSVGKPITHPMTAYNVCKRKQNEMKVIGLTYEEIEDLTKANQMNMLNKYYKQGMIKKIKSGMGMLYSFR